jgi:NAD(P)-dependent dehydrogenase (short-subunit alcohol dehydrogenase family)
MKFDFTHVRVLVTGGTRGIGNAVAKAFLSAGATVAINGRTEQSVNTATQLLKDSDRLISAPKDIGTVAGCETAVSSAIDALGGLDILINGAGVGEDVSIEDSDEKFWDNTLNIDLKGTFFCCRAALGALRVSKGNIANIASDAGLMCVPNSTVCCASKAGVVNDASSAPSARISRRLSDWVKWD